MRRRLEPHIEIRRNNDLEGPDFGQGEFRNIDAEIDIRRIAGWRIKSIDRKYEYI